MLRCFPDGAAPDGGYRWRLDNRSVALLLPSTTAVPLEGREVKRVTEAKKRSERVVCLFHGETYGARMMHPAWSFYDTQQTGCTLGFVCSEA